MPRLKQLIPVLLAAVTLILGGLMQGSSAQTVLSPEAERAAIIDRVNGYFNTLQHLHGRFSQIGPNGEFSEGVFYLERPGKIRFEYALPNPLLVVADGFWVGIEDRNMKTTDKYPLAATPLSLLLEERVDLNEEASIIDAREEEGFISVTFEDKRGAAPGQLTLVFDAETIRLKEWVVVDGQGYQTRISVSDLITGIKQNPSLFYIEKPEFPENEQ